MSSCETGHFICVRYYYYYYYNYYYYYALHRTIWSDCTCQCFVTEFYPLSVSSCHACWCFVTELFHHVTLAGVLYLNFFHQVMLAGALSLISFIRLCFLVFCNWIISASLANNVLSLKSFLRLYRSFIELIHEVIRFWWCHCTISSGFTYVLPLNRFITLGLLMFCHRTVSWGFACWCCITELISSLRRKLN